MTQNTIATEYRRLSLSFHHFILWMVMGMGLSILMYWLVHRVIGAFIAFLIVVMLAAWFFRGRKIAHNLQVLQAWRIPSIYTDQLYHVFPQSTSAQRQWIIEGFKDYLALHILDKKHLAMPSYAVDQLWHILLADPVAYQAMCQQILGRNLHHIAYTEQPTIEETVDQTKVLEQVTISAQTVSAQKTEQEQQEAFAQTWRLSCLLHGFNPVKTETLPRLFAVDCVLGIQPDAHTRLHQHRNAYQQALKNTNSSSCGGSSCSSCGGD